MDPCARQAEQEFLRRTEGARTLARGREETRILASGRENKNFCAGQREQELLRAAEETRVLGEAEKVQILVCGRGSKISCAVTIAFHNF